MRRIPWWVVALFLLAFLLRLYPLETYHGWDESAYLQHAEMIAFGKDNYDEFNYRPPLLPLLLAPILFVWRSPFATDMLVALLAASAVPALFLIGRRLVSVRAGGIAAGIAAVHPAMVQYGHMVLTDAAVVSVVAWAFLFADHEGEWPAFSAGLLAAAAGLMKFTGFAAVPLVGAWAVYRSRKNLVPYILGCTALLLPYAAWVSYTYGSPWAQLSAAQGLFAPTGQSWHAYLSAALFPAGLLGLLFSRNKALWSFAACWTGLFFSYLLFLPVKEIRYALIALPPLFLLAGDGYDRLLSKKPAIATVAVAILILASSAGAFDRLKEPAVHTYVPPAVDIAFAVPDEKPIYATSHYPVLGYYTNSRVVVVDGPAFERGYSLNMPRPGYLVIPKDREIAPTTAWAAGRREFTELYENEQFALYSYVPPHVRSGSYAAT